MICQSIKLQRSDFAGCGFESERFVGEDFIILRYIALVRIFIVDNVNTLTVIAVVNVRADYGTFIYNTGRNLPGLYSVAQHKCFYRS